MKRWAKALLIAGLVEIPLLIAFLAIAPGNLERSVLARILAWYHVVPAYGMALFFLWWNPGPQTVATRTVFIAGVFAIQSIMTSPVVLLVMNWVSSRRKPSLDA